MPGITYVSGPYTSRQLLNTVRSVEDALMDELRFRGVMTDRTMQMDWNYRLQDASHGKNAVIFNTPGYPNIMVHIKGETLKELGLSDTDEHLHPAFNINSTAIPQLYIAKYEATTVVDGETTYAVSLKGRDPRAAITFDNAVLYCENNNPVSEKGWHLMTNAEWAFIASWCKKNGYWPRGNNSYGRDYVETDERGEPTYWSGEDGKTGRIATGSGPRETSAWSHNGTPMGIYDLNGNVSEWVSGLRLVDGEIQVIPNNDAADSDTDLSAESVSWKAILQDGSLVAPGTADTLKIDNTTAGDSTTTHHDVLGDLIIGTSVTNPMYIPGGQVDYGYSVTAFKNVVAAGGVTIPNILKHLALFPLDTNYLSENFFARNYGERMIFKGGLYSTGVGGGVCYSNMQRGRTFADAGVGFRSAYVPDLA
jgi:hypothetical protein